MKDFSLQDISKRHLIQKYIYLSKLPHSENKFRLCIRAENFNLLL